MKLNSLGQKYCKHCDSYEELSHFVPLVKNNGQNYLRCKILLNKKGRYCATCKKYCLLDHFKEFITTKGRKIFACKITLDKNGGKVYGFKHTPENFKWRKRERKNHFDYEIGTEEYDREAHLQRKFKMSLEHYLLLSEAQNNVCAICGKPENGIDKRYNKKKYLAVDHNHDTDEIRGLLCTGCNLALGIFKDNKDILQKAINYLNKYD